MPRSQLLHDLQKADSTSDAIAAKLSRIEAALRGTKALRLAREQVETTQAALTAIEAEVRQSRDERNKVKARIDADKQSMYGGKVKAAREVQNLQLEVEALERRMSTLDDAALELMLRRDQAAEAAAAAKTTLAETEAKLDAQQVALTREAARLESASRTLTVQRERLRKAIPPADLKLYDGLRQTKSGRALAELRGASCGACGIELPVEEVHSVRTSPDLIFCRGCGRILHG